MKSKVQMARGDVAMEGGGVTGLIFVWAGSQAFSEVLDPTQQISHMHICIYTCISISIYCICLANG